MAVLPGTIGLVPYKSRAIAALNRACAYSSRLAAEAASAILGGLGGI
jgi:hypothetical protein